MACSISSNLNANTLFLTTNYESKTKENYKYEKEIESKTKIKNQQKILKDMVVSVHDVASVPLIEADELEPRLNRVRAQDVQFLTTMESVEPRSHFRVSLLSLR
jgi:hypothetical protein